jgi:hypothetical protein
VKTAQPILTMRMSNGAFSCKLVSFGSHTTSICSLQKLFLQKPHFSGLQIGISSLDAKANNFKMVQLIWVIRTLFDVILQYQFGAHKEDPTNSLYGKLSSEILPHGSFPTELPNSITFLRHKT